MVGYLPITKMKLPDFSQMVNPLQRFLLPFYYLGLEGVSTFSF